MELSAVTATKNKVSRQITAGAKLPEPKFGGRKRWAGLSPAGRQLKVGVRIFFKIGSDFVQRVPPIFRIRILGECCLAPPTAGLGFGKPDFHLSGQKLFLDFKNQFKIVIFAEPEPRTRISSVRDELREGEAIPSQNSEIVNWRKGWDSNPQEPKRPAGFQDRFLANSEHPSSILL